MTDGGEDPHGNGPGNTRPTGTSEERVDLILDAVPNAVFVTDADSGLVTDANEAAGTLVGQPVSELVGAPLRDVFPPAPRYDGVTETFRELVADRDGPVPIRVFEGEDNIELKRPDGTGVPVELTVATVSLRVGEAVVAVARNVAERHSREQRLSVFTRILRHNLRNDLSVVRLYAEELAVDADETRRELAETMFSKIDELLALAAKARTVEDVVGGEGAEVQEIAVTNAVRRIVRETEDEFPDASLEVDASAGTTVTTVAGAFEEAVRNVVENAVEHATGSTPRAWVAVNTMGDGVEVVVEDEGPGLPAHERAVLLGGKETQLEHSSGIGLWLINWATTAAEGDVFFEETGDGSRVILWFPDLER